VELEVTATTVEREFSAFQMENFSRLHHDVATNFLDCVSDGEAHGREAFLSREGFLRVVKAAEKP
jgi:hypothetical protein